MEFPTKCPECEGGQLAWCAAVRNEGAAVDGRICMREVGAILVLGCEECSATVSVVDGDEVAAYLNSKQRSRPAFK